MVKYDEFVNLTQKFKPIRDKHLIDFDTFQEMSCDENTIILDSRSAAAFESVHILGSINLPFSDFTKQSLKKKIPSKDTRILIYCNNNFDRSNLKALLSKMPPLALNIPTFINLHGYGYENVYELDELMDIQDPRLELEGGDQAVHRSPYSMSLGLTSEINISQN